MVITNEDRGGLSPRSGLIGNKFNAFGPRSCRLVNGSGLGTMPDLLHSKHKAMNSLINLIIVLLIVGWLIGYIGFGSMVGSLIHILLVLAVIGIVYRLITGRRVDL